MKVQLSDDYEISVDDMVPVNEPIGKFEVFEAEFYNKKSKKVKMKILSNRDDLEQIFKMKDGLFILEMDNDGDSCTYFSSTDINDLV